MATDDDVIERAGYYQTQPGTWALKGGNTANLIDDLVSALRASRARVEELTKYRVRLNGLVPHPGCACRLCGEVREGFYAAQAEEKG